MSSCLKRWQRLKTFIMPCVFTGKTQRDLSARSSAESGDYAKVKAAVLKNYKLVSEAYEQR